MATQHFAVFFADVAGSSSLYKKIGDEQARGTMYQCLSLMTRIAEENGGTVVKTIGDELMVRFNSADDAVCAARTIHQQLHLGHFEATGRLSVKIGIHYGPAILEQGDIFGDTVNTAARMVSIATPEQIVVTEETVAGLSPIHRSCAQPFDNVKIKAFDKDIPLYLINWRDYDSHTVTMLSAGSSLPMEFAKPGALRLIYQGREIALIAGMANFNIGRDEALCDLVVNVQLASRKHVWIEFRRGKFVLVDHSSNGTWVRTGDDKEIYLRREELPLWGNGHISLGEPPAGNREHRIAYHC
jgi:adenylate cyclase